MAPAAESDIENVCDRCLWVVGIMAQELKIPLGIRRARMNYHPAERLRVCPKTSGGITKFSEHEAD